ncbi:MAG: carbohydrate kinase [Bacteroidales bacterium]|nr:carbohydrate kinase [Bacteroidales bacterium]
MLWTSGEALIDIIVNPRGGCTFNPGGSMLNTAMNLGRRGVSVGFVGISGEDAAGNFLRKYLMESGINTSHLSSVTGFRTPMALAFLDAQGKASYTFYRDTLPADHLYFPETGEGDIILVGSYQSIQDEVHHRLMDWVQVSRSKGALIIYDPNFRRPHLHDLQRLLPRILCLMQHADIVKASDEDLQLVLGIADGRQAWERISGLGPQALAYTMGADGAAWFDRWDEIRLPAPEVEVISTIGAGDAFNAGLMAGLADYSSLEGFMHDRHRKNEVMNQAIQIASEVCRLESNFVDRQH